MEEKKIENLKKNNIGDFVYYKSVGCLEMGRIKKFNNFDKIAWVVFSCDGNWDRYKQFTAEACDYKDIVKLTTK